MCLGWNYGLAVDMWSLDAHAANVGLSVACIFSISLLKITHFLPIFTELDIEMHRQYIFTLNLQHLL